MQAILAVTFPFFALVLLGYVAAWHHMLPESAIPGLNGFVLFFALPCMLFRFGMSRPLVQLVDPALTSIYLASALLIVALTIAVTLRRGADEASGVLFKDAAFGALVAAFPNTGFMGLPLLLGLFGERAAGPIVGTLLVDLIVTSSLCLALAQAHAPGAPQGLAASFGRALRGAVGNPLPWAIALGAAAGASGVAIPDPLMQLVRMLADAATPVALFTIGAVLWRAGQHAHSVTPVGRYLPVALVKLLLHPLVVLAFGLLAARGGAAVPSFGLMVLVLVAALPSASNVSVLAERYGADNGRVARIIMASTTLAFVSFSLIAWAFRARGG